jgi:hypothetical protein
MAPPGTIPPQGPRHQCSGWQAEQDALREEAEREHYRKVAEQEDYERQVKGRGDVVRVIR